MTLHALLNALTVLAAMRRQSCQPWCSYRQAREPLTQRQTQTPVTLPHCCAYPTRILATLTRVESQLWPLAWQPWPLAWHHCCGLWPGSLWANVLRRPLARVARHH